MKKLIVLGIIVLMVTGVTFAEAQTPPVKLEEIIAKKKAELNGKEYTIELKPMGTSPKAKVKVEQDVISFSEDKVTLKNLAGLGYAPSNFSVRLEENGTLICETMQRTEKGELAFLRADIGQDGVMRGVLSKQDAKGKVSDFNFVSVAK